MCYAGPIGRDLGIMAAFPLACALSHAISGHPDASYDVTNFVEIFWSTYVAARAKTEGPTRACEMYRNALGWTGVFLSFYVLADIHLEFLPLSTTSRDFEIVKDSLGILTLNLLRLGFSECTTGSTLPELKAEFAAAVDEQVMFVQQTEQGRRPSRTRRSSRLRESGVRVSDTNMQVPQSRTLRGKVMAVVAMKRIEKGIKGMFVKDVGEKEEGGKEEDGRKDGGGEKGKKEGEKEMQTSRGRNGATTKRFFTSF